MQTLKSLIFFGMPEFLNSGRKSWTLDSGRWILDAGHSTLNTGRWTLDAGLWTVDAGLWTLDSRCWTLDTGLLTLDAGRWTLDSGRWTLDTVVDCCRTESEHSFWFCLIKLLKILWVLISKDHGLACSVETIGSDVTVFRNSIQRYLLHYKRMRKEIFIVRNRITLQAAILDCSEVAFNRPHFRKFLQETPVVESFFWSNYTLAFRVTIIY